MAIPSYDRLLLPLLSALSDGREWSMRDLREALANQLGLAPEERQQLLPGGSGPVLNNRVGWARTYLKKALLLEIPRRGFAQITERGRILLMERPASLGSQDLLRYPEFADFLRQTRSVAELPAQPESDSMETATPEERLQSAFAEIQEGLKQDLLRKVMECSPDFFEGLVLDLLVKMGYGGSLGEAQRVGRSGDGGIDGLIKADPLGLNQVYIQAKRWRSGNTVGRPDIQGFVGALEERGARHGVFITTSEFTREASDYATRITQKRVILVNGRELTGLMVRFSIGLSPRQSFVIHDIDSDYFVES